MLPSALRAALRLLLLSGLAAAAACSNSDPVRNLANQAGNAGPPANVVGDIDASGPGTRPNGTRIALGQPVWASPLPPPGPITVGRRR